MNCGLTKANADGGEERNPKANCAPKAAYEDRNSIGRVPFFKPSLQDHRPSNDIVVLELLVFDTGNLHHFLGVINSLLCLAGNSLARGLETEVENYIRFARSTYNNDRCVSLIFEA